jgi:hypothetical protein
MLTNTLLLYMTQEAIAKARAKLTARRADAPQKDAAEPLPVRPAWQAARRPAAKPRTALRH